MFEWPTLMNAGGTCKTVEDAERLIPAADALVVGSITALSRPGNEGEVYWYDERTGTSYNSLNMPNAGKDEYRQRLLPAMLNITRAAGKPLIANVAGFNITEFEALVSDVLDAGVDGVEMNFGCPNTGEAIFSFDPDALHETVHRVREQHPSAWLAGKVSPITDPAMRHRVITALSLCNAVVVTNTLPNARAFRPDGTTAIQAKNPNGDSVTIGGGAGAALRSLSLTMAAEAREWLSDSVAVVRVGGISSGADLLDSERAGVQAVGVATALLEEGPRVFTRLRESYVDAGTRQ